MSESNVVGMPGRSVTPSARQPNEDVIAFLEKWLERARDGEVQAVTLGAVIAAGNGWDVSIDYDTGNAPANMMLSAASALEALVKRAWLQVWDG